LWLAIAAMVIEDSEKVNLWIALGAPEGYTASSRRGT